MSFAGADAESLPRKILELHRVFAEQRIPYGFGGAIALAYHAEQRATDDIDVNVLVPPERGDSVLAVMESLFPVDRTTQAEIGARDQQTRLRWGRTYVDLFFMDTAFHESLASRIRS